VRCGSGIPRTNHDVVALDRGLLSVRDIAPKHGNHRSEQQELGDTSYDWL
jgi:hypothetical protein